MPPTRYHAPVSTYKPVPEPDWRQVLAAVEDGTIKVTADMEAYLNQRAVGLDHAAAAARVGLQKFPGFILRRRLIDGWDRLGQIRASQPQEAAG